MIDTTEHALIPAADEAAQAERLRCAADGHPAGVYNPWMNVTFCRCGACRGRGDQSPKPGTTPVCDLFQRVFMGGYCRNCFHDKDEHQGGDDGTVHAQ